MGDPVCWLDQTCPSCGAILDDRTARPCPRCEREPGETSDRDDPHPVVASSDPPSSPARSLAEHAPD